MKKLISISAMLLLAIFVYGQGSTTSTMSGKVSDSSSDEALIGANVFVVHVPSNTTYNASTDLEGNYHIPGMRVGGPYKINITYIGYEIATYEGIYLSLGQPYRLNCKARETAVDLSIIEVVAQKGPAGGNIGSSTIIKADDINRMPTLSRNLNDFTRLTPQSKSTFEGGTSIAGINNRYNAVYIDGAVNNDVFGLAANGTNGGQTGIAPISIDAIDQIQVVVSPYDVTLGGFAGGGINAVTKSGTNNIEGSAYYFMQNEAMAGETNATLLERTGSEAEKLDEFSNELYGLSLGGPIVKNKVFFFFNGEIQKDQTPVPFDFGIYEGNSTEADLENLRDRLMSDYGYDPGNFGSKTDKLEGLRLFGKLDFNLNDKNKLTVRHQYTKAEQLNVNGSGSRTINFENNGILFPSVTNSFAAELNSMFGIKASNNLIVGITTVRDDRDPIGGDFPYLDIDDGDGSIRLGSERFSTANILNQDIVTITNNFKLYKGDHTLTFGTHNEFTSFNNLFIRENYGVYEFGSVDDFLNGENADRFFRSYSLVDDITGDESTAAANFSAMQLGFYVQDEWLVSNQLTVTAGVRLDIPVILDDPTISSNFNSTTLNTISAAYDLKGATGGTMPEGQLMISPRMGFQYNASQQTAIRGGLGIFTSRIPFVWPGGAFINNGLTVGAAVLTDVAFEADILKQPINPDFSVPSGQVDLFSQDFKYPQVFRASLALDRELPGGIQATIEGIYTKTLNNIIYTNVNTDPTIDFNWTGTPDDRPVFVSDPDNVFLPNSLDESYTAIYLASNTSEGDTYNLTASLAKDFKFGLNAYLAYTYGDANSLMEGTSSQNSSQWRGGYNVDGRNNPSFGRSDFSIGSRLIAALGYDLNWSKAVRTSFSLFYNGQSGDPYSYVYGGRDARNINNETGSTSLNNSLIWIPASQSEINLVDPSQWAALNTFIEEDDYLSANRGSYAEKNGARTPWISQIDIRLAQSFAVKSGPKTNRLEVSLDIFNFANLLNSSAGVIYSKPFGYQVIDFEGYDADGTTPLFSFDEDQSGNDRFDIFDRGSRWRMRLGVRYTFN